MSPTEIPAWLQAGGLLAFAAAVWMEQRAIRASLEAQKNIMAAILEYVRNTEPGKYKRPSSNPAIEDKTNDLKA